MQEFELKLSGVEYKCSGGISNATSQNWVITAAHDKIRITITIPQEAEVTRARCLAFVEAFHVALSAAKKDQKL